MISIVYIVYIIFVFSFIFIYYDVYLGIYDW